MEQLCFNGGGIIVSMFIVKLGTESVAANAVSNSTLMVFLLHGTRGVQFVGYNYRTVHWSKR